MARAPRFCPAGLPQHIVQRGNNRNTCFTRPQDFAVYADWLCQYADQFDVAVHAWVFMTNHTHLLATPTTADGISRLMQSLGRRYVQYFNKAFSRTGTLWEGRYRSSLVGSENYLLACYRYIELNPVRAGMVEQPQDYPWSSYRCNAHGLPTRLCTPHPQYLALGTDQDERLSVYRRQFDPVRDGDLVSEISAAVNKGIAFGSEQFKDEIERAYTRRVRPGRAGRRKRAEMCI